MYRIEPNRRRAYYNQGDDNDEKQPGATVTYLRSQSKVVVKREGERKLDATISRAEVGVHVHMQGSDVVSLNGRASYGSYPVKFTIPGETPPERIAEVIKKTFDGLGIKKDNGLGERVSKAAQLVIPQRGFMDPKKEIPEKFFELVPEEWLKRGLKGASRDGDTEDRSNTGAGNWSLDIYTSAFFKNAHDERDRLTNEEFENIFKKAAKGVIDQGTAEREMRAKNQLKVHLEIKDGLRASFKSGILKEKPWSYKNWDKVLPDFEELLIRGVLTAKTLNAFISSDNIPAKNEKPRKDNLFLPVLMKHPNEIAAWPAVHGKQAEIRDEFLGMLAKWPKTERMAQLLDQAFNNGIPLNMFVERKIMKPGELENLIETAKSARYLAYKEKTLNSNYEPPDIKLPKGWKWADHTDFSKLGDMYRCCISDSDFYEREICEGRAHVMYLTDRSAYPGKKNDNDKIDEDVAQRYEYGKNGKGALAFIYFNRERWDGGEIRAFANEEPHRLYRAQVEVIAKEMTKSHPFPYPIIPQEKESEKTQNEVNNFQLQKERIGQERPIIQYTSFNTEDIKKIVGLEVENENESDIEITTTNYQIRDNNYAQRA